jgi:hypothetical protein
MTEELLDADAVPTVCRAPPTPSRPGPGTNNRARQAGFVLGIYVLVVLLQTEH